MKTYASDKINSKNDDSFLPHNLTRWIIFEIESIKSMKGIMGMHIKGINAKFICRKVE
jgi:hypothetical protein